MKLLLHKIEIIYVFGILLKILIKLHYNQLEEMLKKLNVFQVLQHKLVQLQLLLMKDKIK